MRIAVFSSYFPPANLGGGPIRTLGALVANLPDDTEAVVITRNTDLGFTAPMSVTSDVWLEFGDAKVRYVSSGSVVSWWKAVGATRSFQADFVYVNSFFDARFSILPQVLARLGAFGRVRVVMAPRGEFGSGVMALKRRKKQVYLRVFRMLCLGRGLIWHASSQRERGDIVNVIGHEAHIVVRENSTDLPFSADGSPDRKEGPLRAVYLARLVPIKRLALLLSALQDVTAPLSLDVFGPAEDVTYAKHCRQIADSFPDHIDVRFRGPIDHAMVRSTLSDYDVMLFPTGGENFGHVIAEALSVACPVMCADTTPWTPRLRDGGGVVVDADTVEGWTHAVDDYAVQLPDQLEQRRRQAATAYAEWRQEASEHEHFFTMLSRSRPQRA